MSASITYIIVTWNNKKEIKECLKTVEEYSPSGYQVFVVDNASTDITTSIIEKNFPKARLIKSKENLGFAEGNNLALKDVKTDYVCFLNPDVILTEDIATPSIRELEQDSNIGLISCRLNNRDGSWQPSTFGFANSRNLYNEILHVGAFMPQKICRKKYINHYHPTESFSPDWVIGAEMVMRTADAKKIGVFSTEYYMYTEDMDFCKKIETKLQKKILFLPNVSLIHLGGAREAQNVNYKKQKKLFENDLIFVKKFYGEEEAERTLKSIKHAYRIRERLLKTLYYKPDREKQIRNTGEAINILQEITI